MIARAAIVAAARSWLGVPYLHQGRAAHGLDCVGLLIMVGRAVGLLPGDWDMRNYPRAMPPAMLLAQLDAWLERIESDRLDALAPGDVLVMAARPRVWHVGFLGDRQTVIHAWSPAGKVIEHGLSREWLYQRQAAYRLPGAA